jgi:hypothetical protein
MNQILAYIGYFFLLLNFILFLKSIAHKGKAYKLFVFYLGLILIVQILSEILIRKRTNNLYLSHFYFIGQFIILSLFYFNLLKKVDLQRKIVKGGLVAVLLILGVQYFNDPSLFLKFNLFEIFITSFVIIIYAAFHFYNLLNEKKEFYYINIGILMYLFGSTVLFLAGNFMTSLSPEINQLPWIFNSFLYIVYQVFILIEWKKSYSKKKLNS